MDERGGNDTCVHCGEGPKPVHHLYRGDCGTPNAPFQRPSGPRFLVIPVSKAVIMLLVP